MANGNGNGEYRGWTLILPVGALTLLGGLLLSVSRSADVALDMARQHGESLNVVRGKISAIEGNRYTSKDAERDLSYLRRDIDLCMVYIKDHENATRNNEH